MPVKSHPLKTVWILLNRTERQRAALLIAIMLIGVLFELVSFGALLPILSLLADTTRVSEVPILGEYLSVQSNSVILIVAVASLMFVFVLKSLYVVWSLWFQREFCRRIEQRITDDVLFHYLSQPYIFHVNHNSAILVRNVGVASRFVSLAVDSILIMGTDGGILVALSIFLLAIEPLATVIVLLTIGLFGSLFHALTRNSITNWGKSRINLESQKLQVLQEGFAAIKEIKALECEDAFSTRFHGFVSESTRISRNYTVLTSAPRVWLELLAFIGMGSLLITLSLRGESLGDSIPVLALFAASAFRIMPTVNRIIFAAQNLRFSESEIQILRMLELEKGAASKDYPNRVGAGDIEFRNVSFGYPHASNLTIRNASLTIYQGQLIGLCGASGSGKSTFGCLVLGLLQPSSGEIFVGQVALRGSAGRSIGYVPQSVYLIDDSIRKNVAFGIPPNQIDDARILDVLRQVSMAEFIKENSDGLDFVVGENGSRLSGGQRQRIGIARALYGDPSILVLDEATSALDSVVASQIIREIAAIRESKTIVFISHDPSVLASCEVVFELEAGLLRSLRVDDLGLPEMKPSP